MCFSRLFTVSFALAGALWGQAPAAGAAQPPTPREDGLYAIMQTTSGVFTIKLFEQESPVTVANFVDLATGRKAWTDPKTNARVRRPLYTGLTFHRVIPGFMIQGGDPTGTGMGGTDVIKDEFHPALKFDVPGRLAMANAGPGTGSCQFFITEVPTPHLNGKHTIFGQVIENQELVGRITRVPRNAQDKPQTAVRIEKLAFERWKDGAMIPLRPTAAKKAAVKKAAPKTAPAAAPKTPPAAAPKTAPKAAPKTAPKTAPAAKP
jgi:peptidyl-prolyl cis-trans isomerase A (cyclophilin A)